MFHYATELEDAIMSEVSDMRMKPGAHERWKIVAIISNDIFDKKK